jgi:hypothetical protein
MVQEKIPVVIPGQKFRHKRKGTVYIVRSIQDNTVLLISEKGEAIRRIQLDFMSLSDLEPIYD